MEHLRSENAKLKTTLYQQQDHIQQLTQSLNQCFQAVLTIQRDVSALQRAMPSVENSANTANYSTNSANLEDNLDSVSLQRDFSHPSSSWEFDLLQQPTPAAPLDPWSNFFGNQDSRFQVIFLSMF